MEEDVGVKATVTRLRRRLSVEQSDDASSPAPSTPTKKRVGRLAAKPQLELIDENAQVSSPRKIRRKSLATDTEENKVTPSRRSARIKSNSSIVSETHPVLVTESPRARRAARRNSQAGSDNEGPATPARQTRRTRKDSASSVENQESSTLNRPLPVAEMVIEEEPEIEGPKSLNKSKSFSTPTEELSPSARKSKRLSEKKRRSGSLKAEHDCSTCSTENKSINVSNTNEKALSETESQSRSPLNKSVKPKESNQDLSESDKSLLKKLDTGSKMNTSNHNKSSAVLDTAKNDKSKRNRTESWPTARKSVANDSVNFSDNEISKRKKEKSGKLKLMCNNTSGVGANDESPKIYNTNTSMYEINTSQSFSETSTKRKKRQSESSSTKNPGNPENIQTMKTVLPKGDSNSTDITRDMAMFFESAPENVQAIIVFNEGSDNSICSGTANKIEHLESEDQCVPVIKHSFQESLSLKEPTVVPNTEEISFSIQTSNDQVSCTKEVNDDINDSCEPMDIDETIHEEILQKSPDTLQQSKTECKPLSRSQRTTTIEENDKSKRKYSISNSAADTPERSKNDNKSTLILSRIKDVSSTSDNLKSPLSTQINEVLSKSDINIHGDGSKKMFKSNISLNEVKGTPKHNNIQKLTMQTSTPITTHQLEVKTKEEENQLSVEQNKSNFSNNVESSEEETDDDDKAEKSKLLDDEAEEASDDYESGDSQDEEERKYQVDNEIVERGETLTSDDDISNDSDYEKDSFVVSSDAADNELLSGSDDDLSMGDNELSMSKKSKKKFNDRKLKEQKKASREMFESRHKLNTSDKKSPTPKTKKKRMRIDSSLLESDEEVVVKPKKNNRMRLNSTLDMNAQPEDTNLSLNKSNKNNKSMPDSTLDTSFKQEDINESLKKTMKNKSKQDYICDKSAIDEKEITLYDKSLIDNTDPLQVQFKQEPKTPQNDLNISVVQFTDRQEIEKLQITESNSILNRTGSDPLQTTMAYEDSSDSSENEEIMQNYDSVLIELKEKNKIKLSNNNVSLNIENKPTKNRVEPIIDQLNITNTKKSQSENVIDLKTVVLSEKKQVFDNDDSSNSIDLHLLFSEDNCGSEDEHMGNKPQLSNGDDDNVFVPLKKTPGKTNVRENIEINISLQHALTLNESTNKKKKRKSSLGPAIEEQDIDMPDTLINENSKEKNKRKSSLVPTEAVEEDGIDMPDTLINENSKKKNKRKSSLVPSEAVEEDGGNDSILNKSGSKKNKKRTSSLILGSAEEPKDASESVLNKSTSKKNKHRSSLAAAESQEIQVIPTASEPVLNESIKKRQKRKSSLAAPDTEQPEGELFFIDTEGTLQDTKDDYGEHDKFVRQNVLHERKKRKKEIYSDVSQNKIEQRENTIEESNSAVTPKNEKKEKKRSQQLKTSENTIEESNSAVTSKNEKKRSQKLKTFVCDDDSDGAPDEAAYVSEKATEADLQNLETVNGSAEIDSGKKKNKKKKKKKSPADANTSDYTIDTEVNIPSNSKKRKRMFSNAEDSQESRVADIQDVEATGAIDELASSHKKKRKISHNDGDNTSDTSEQKHTKKKIKKDRDVNFEGTASGFGTAEIQVKKTKKRKHREEDSDTKKTKVSKDHSLQEVHVPRLPDSIISQLEEKRKKIDGAQVISTSHFVVENARQKRAKPSNYLEESIYLNADSPIAKKEKPRMKKPKVLPFIPTASISDSGFTTNFKINKLSLTTKFEAEPFGFSKESYLQKKKIKKLGTYDKYKKQIHYKMSKF